MLIKTRLQLLFAFLVIVFLSTGGLMIGALQDLEKAVTEGSSGRLRLIQSGQIRDQILSASAEVEDLANWNAEDRSRFFGLLESCKETIQQMRLGLTGEDDPLKGTIESLSRPVTDFGRAVTRALRYLDEEGPASRRLNLPRNWLKTRLIPEITESLQELEQQLQSRLAILDKLAVVNYQRIKIVFLGTGLSLILLGIVFFYLVRRWIVTPLELLSAATREISSGKYGETISIASESEIGQLGRDVESMSEEISRAQSQLVDRERLAAVGEMTATIAHNIRNPLGSIRALAQGRMRSDGGSDPDMSMQTILETVDRADRWLKDLLKGLKPIQLTYGEAQLDSRLPALCEAVSGYADKRQVSVKCQITGTLPAARIDERKIEQSILVLLNNAIESCNPGGVVSLSGRSSGDEIFIEVQDTGHGMTAEVLAQLFKPYFTTKKSGLGLGLSLTQRIVVGHGGKIEVESESGKGSRFLLTIPTDSQNASGQKGTEHGTNSDPRR